MLLPAAQCCSKALVLLPFPAADTNTFVLLPATWQVQAARKLCESDGSKCDAFDYQHTNPHATTNTTPHYTSQYTTPDTTPDTSSLNSRHCCRSQHCHCSEWQHLHRSGIRAQLQVLTKQGLEHLCAPHHWSMGELHFFSHYWRFEAESRTAVLDLKGCSC